MSLTIDPWFLQQAQRGVAVATVPMDILLVYMCLLTTALALLHANMQTRRQHGSNAIPKRVDARCTAIHTICLDARRGGVCVFLDGINQT